MGKTKRRAGPHAMRQIRRNRGPKAARPPGNMRAFAAFKLRASRIESTIESGPEGVRTMYAAMMTAVLTTLLPGATTDQGADVPGRPPPRVEREMFDRWDTDRDGSLDRDEFARAMRALRDRAGRRGNLDARPMPPRPPRAEGVPDLDRRIREVVGQTVKRIHRRHQERIARIIHDAVERALRGGGDSSAGRRGPGPAFGDRRGPRGGGEGRHRMFRPQRPECPPPPAECPIARARRPAGRGDPADGRPAPRAERRHRQFDQLDRDDDDFMTPDEPPRGARRFRRDDVNDDGRFEREGRHGPD